MIARLLIVKLYNPCGGGCKNINTVLDHKRQLEGMKWWIWKAYLYSLLQNDKTQMGE